MMYASAVSFLSSVSWILHVRILHFDAPWRTCQICRVLSGRLCAWLLWYLLRSIRLPPLHQCNREECWLASQIVACQSGSYLELFETLFPPQPCSLWGFKNSTTLEVPVAVGPSFASTCSPLGKYSSDWQNPVSTTELIFIHCLLPNMVLGKRRCNVNANGTKKNQITVVWMEGLQ